MSIGVPSGWTIDGTKKAAYDSYYAEVMVAGYTLSGACLMCYSSPAKDAYIFVTNVDSPLLLTADRVVEGTTADIYEDRFPGFVQVGDAEMVDKMTAVLSFTCDDGNGKMMLHVNANPPQVWNVNIVYEAGALDESTIDDIFASFTVL